MWALDIAWFCVLAFELAFESLAFGACPGFLSLRESRFWLLARTRFALTLTSVGFSLDFGSFFEFTILELGFVNNEPSVVLAED